MNFRSAAVTLICLACVGCGGGVKPFELFSIDGKTTYGLSDYKGQVVVLDFWATWCTPCKMVQPVIKGWAEKYSSKGVTVIGVTEEAPKVVGDFVSKTPLGYPALIDRGDRVQEEFKVIEFPTLIILDRGGSVAYQGSPFMTGKVAGILNNLTAGK